MKIGYKISSYILRSVTPYFLMSWLILTVILFLQQASRYSEIFFTPNLPSSFAWQIAGALIPNVIAYTCPMAVLVGVIVGLSRMQADSELVAIRSFGTGNLSILLPILIFGALLSAVSLAINVFGVPLAAQAVRAAALESALYKLKSPIEPGVFNTEIAGFTVYVKGGDVERGTWNDVVIFSEDGPGKASRLITSTEGRIDSEGQSSELVLKDASVTTFPAADGKEGIVTEQLGEFRLSIRTRRDEMVERLTLVQPSLEEMGLGSLATVAQTGNEKESREAKILIVRRLVLAVAPLIFCLLGTLMVLRYDRRGRGFGISLAIVVLVLYFLLSFAGEQLARSGSVSPIVGGLFPIVAAGVASAYFLIATRFPSIFDLREYLPKVSGRREGKVGRSYRGTDVILDISTGIRDFDLIANVLKYYVLAIGFIGSIFIVFTAFELWRFASSFEQGTVLLLQYIAYLIPFIYLQVSSTAVLIAILTVLTIKSRQNEIVTWLTTGQSVYRLILPILVLMLFLGSLNFVAQEYVSTKSNIRQEALRQTIRNRGVEKKQGNRVWIAEKGSIYSFELEKSASDNGSPRMSFCISPCSLKNISIYNFGVDKGELQSVYRIPGSVMEGTKLTASAGSREIELKPTGTETIDIGGKVIDIGFNLTSGAARSPSQESAANLRSRLERTDSNIERRTLSVALERKYTSITLPMVIALLAIPFGIAIERRNRVTQIAYAVGLWLVFVVFSSVFEQFGLNGMLHPAIAVWSPVVLFAILGSYLISRIRT